MIKAIIAGLVKFHQRRQEPAFYWPKIGNFSIKGIIVTTGQNAVSI